MKKLTLFTLSACLSLGAFAQNMVVNGGFELPDDGVKHLLITERAGWLSDDVISNDNGTEFKTDMSGKYYQYCVNTAGSIYQAIDKISDKTATYHVSYLSGVSWNNDAGNDTMYSVVYFSHFSPGNIKTRILIDSIATDITSEAWKSVVNVSFSIPDGASYAGDSLTVEFATRVWDHHAVNTNSWTGMDSIVVKKVTTYTLPLVNGGFELPDDGVKHLLITERAGWLSDDATSNDNGTEFKTDMSGKYYQYCVNTAGTIYQPIDKISSDSATYNVSYLSGVSWNADAGYDTMYSVVYFSHFSPGNIKTRTLIDSLATDITAESWKSVVNVSFKIPEGVSYAGDSLTVEFATRVWDHHAVNTNSWTGMDSIFVSKTGIYVPPVSAPLWSTFPIANVTDGKTLPKDFWANVKMRWDADSIYTILTVKDDSIMHLMAPKTQNIWEIDNIEIYFDMTNGKLANWPRSSGWPPAYTNGSNGYWQLRVVPDSLFSGEDQSGNLMNPSSLKGVNLKYKRNAADSTYTFTINYPIDSLLNGYTVEVGDTIGYDLNVSDNNNNPYYRNQITMNCPNTLIYVDPASWASLKLVDGGLFVKLSDNKAPTAPANLAAVSTKSKVKLTWDASTDNTVVQHYIVTFGTKSDTLLALKTGNSLTTDSLADGSYTFTVVAVDLYGNKSTKGSKSIDIITTSVKNNSLATIEVYPNPAGEFINLKNVRTNSKLSVYDVTGKLVLQSTLAENTIVNIGSLNSGLYMIKVLDGNNTFIGKIIKR